MVQTVIIVLLSLCLIIQAIIYKKDINKNKNKVIVVEYKDDSYTHIVKVHPNAYTNMSDATYFAYKQNIKYFKVLPIIY